MSDDVIELGRLADENLMASWVKLGSGGGASIRTSGSAAFVATGIPVAFFNGVFVAGPVDEPDRLIADAIEFMGECGVPWLLWLRDGVDSELLAAGRRAGLTEAGGPPGMVLPAIPDTPAAPAELEITTVSDAAGVEVFRDLTARGFGLPMEIVERIVAEPLLDDPEIALVVGSVEETPVSCAMLSTTGSTAGIYNVATPAEHRRRGYGAAVTWAAIEHGVRRGCDHSVLQASEMGAPVYRAMGFTDIGPYVQLEGSAPAT